MSRFSTRLKAGMLHGSLVLSLVIFTPSASSNAIAPQAHDENVPAGTATRHP